MEPRFGQDFSNVRVHTDAKAARSADAIDAVAYAAGRHIVIPSQAYHDRSQAGRALLAHELAHVVQQSHIASGAESAASFAPNDDAAENEAERTARLILERERADVTQATGYQIQRQRSEDPIHQGLVEDYRRRHGLPEFERDESGELIGPSEAEIKYRLLPADFMQQSYERSMASLQQFDADIHRYLSRAPLNGGRTSILAGSAVDSSTTPPTTVQFTFNLTVETANLGGDREAVFDGGIPVLSPSGTSRTLVADMTMRISRAAAFDPAVLTRALYHEGLHLLLFVQDLMPPRTPSAHVGALANYRRIALAISGVATLQAELEVFMEVDWRTRGVTPMPNPQRAAQDIFDHLVEEKYVFDQERRHFGGPGTPNRALASGYLMDGFRDMGVRADLGNAQVADFVTRLARILDEIDRSSVPPARPQPATAPTPQPRP